MIEFFVYHSHYIQNILFLSLFLSFFLPSFPVFLHSFLFYYEFFMLSFLKHIYYFHHFTPVLLPYFFQLP
jgi:hypothetical protein